MRRITQVAGTLVVLAFPLLVYWGMTRVSTRAVGMAVAGVVLARAVLSRRAVHAEHLRALLVVPLGIAALALVSVGVNDPRFILACPALVNGFLLVTFWASLSGPMPLVERMARLQVSDLSEAERQYCRGVTVLWCVFFAMNGLITVLLAVAAPMAWWALYAGLLSYVAMGTLFAGEFVVRKYRFRRYGTGWHDRLFAWIFPPFGASSSERLGCGSSR